MPRQVRPYLALLALPLVAASACEGPDDVPSNVAAGATVDATVIERTELLPGGRGRPSDDARELGDGRRFHFDVEDGDLSVLLTFALESGEDVVGITRLSAPDGTVVHATRFESDSWDAALFVSEIATWPIVGTGDLALFLPVSPDKPLESGRWSVDYETDPPDAAFVHATRTVRRDPSGAVANGGTQVVDLYLHVVHPDDRYRTEDFADVLERDWRPALDRVLAPHALGIGRITFGVASTRETSRLAEIDDEREATEACRLTRRHGPDADEHGSPALHVGFVATLSGDLAWSGEVDDDLVVADAKGVADDRQQDGESYDDGYDDGAGVLTGLSPQPGLPFDDESPNACVFVAERPWREGYEPGEAPGEDAVVELLAANLLHELGHFASLAHPSEADGKTFDLLEDTPRCTEPDLDACGVAGGADNLMFLSGDESTLPWTLTDDQAWVLHRHPLFHPAEP